VVYELCHQFEQASYCTELQSLCAQQCWSGEEHVNRLQQRQPPVGFAATQALNQSPSIRDRGVYERKLEQATVRVQLELDVFGGTDWHGWYLLVVRVHLHPQLDPVAAKHVAEQAALADPDRTKRNSGG
jgi:hypothetical protein